MQFLQDYLSIFIVSFTVALSGAMMPGPLLAGVVYESSQRGVKAGPLMILGHGLGEIGIMAGIFFGITHFVEAPLVLQIISIAGAFIMVYFGVNILRSIPELSLNFETEKTKSTNLVLKGLTLSVANPYWSIWWLTIGMGLLLSSKSKGVLAIIVFFLGHIMADLSWYSIVSSAIARGRKFISLKLYKAITALLGIFLIFLGLYFMKQSFHINLNPGN